MKFTDDAWEMYKQRYGVSDKRRPIIEQGLTEDITRYEARSGGDHELAVGLMTLDTIRDMARDFGLPEAELQENVIRMAPKPALMQHCIKKAREHMHAQRQ